MAFCVRGMYTKTFFFKGNIVPRDLAEQVSRRFCVYGHTGLVLNTFPGMDPKVRPVIRLGARGWFGWSSARTALFSPQVC